MISQEEINEIKKTTEELLQKMIISSFTVEVTIEGINKEGGDSEVKDVVSINISVAEPQFLIGQNGQTLLDLQRILRVMLNKKLKKAFYVTLDINNYQKQKIEYLKKLAIETANEVVVTQQPKSLPPMPAHERRIVHEELSIRQDVVTTSQGESSERYVVVAPK